MPGSQRRQPVRLLVFSASLRRDSLNTRLAELAAAAIEAAWSDGDRGRGVRSSESRRMRVSAGVGLLTQRSLRHLRGRMPMATGAGVNAWVLTADVGPARGTGSQVAFLARTPDRNEAPHQAVLQCVHLTDQSFRPDLGMGLSRTPVSLDPPADRQDNRRPNASFWSLPSAGQPACA